MQRGYVVRDHTRTTECFLKHHSEIQWEKSSHKGTSAPGVIHYSIKQKSCQICPSKMSCLGKPWMFCYITLKQVTEQRQDSYSRCWTFPTDIWTPLARLVEREAKDVPSDPKVCLAVTPAAALDKAGSLGEDTLGTSAENWLRGCGHSHLQMPATSEKADENKGMTKRSHHVKLEDIPP